MYNIIVGISILTMVLSYSWLFISRKYHYIFFLLIAILSIILIILTKIENIFFGFGWLIVFIFSILNFKESIKENYKN